MKKELTNEIGGLHALQLARELSKVPGMTFTLAFFQYSRTKQLASDKLETKKGCTVRKQLPADQFSIDSENLFLFTDGDNHPRMCYRYLMRYIGFPQDNFKLHKINWFKI